MLVRTVIVTTLSILAGSACERLTKLPTQRQTLRTSVDQKTEMDVFRNGDSFNVKYRLQYQNAPVDYLIIRDVDANFSGDREAAKLKSAMKTVAARMQFAPYDAKIVIANALAVSTKGFGNGGGAAAPGPIFSDVDGPIVLSADHPNLADVLAKRLDSKERFAANGVQPVASIKQVVEAALKANPPVLRGDAKLAILSMQFAPASEEAMGADDLAKYLDQSIGVNKWSLATLTATATELEKGCGPTDNFVNLLDKAIPDRVPEAEQRPLIKMALASTGLTTSPCQPSYLMFFDRYFLEGAKQETVTVTLPEKAIWKSLKVIVDGVEYLGWKYEPGTTELKLWRVLPPGKEFNVTFNRDVKGEPQTVPKLEPITERQLSPDELTFVNQINPILFQYCNNCHGQQAANKQYVGNYLNTKNDKSKILDRLQKPDDDPARMPQAKVQIDPTFKATLLEWLKS